MNLAPLDIFLVTPDGIMWKGTADNLEVAKRSVQKLMESTPGDYLVYCQIICDKVRFKADGTVEPSVA